MSCRCCADASGALICMGELYHAGALGLCCACDGHTMQQEI